MHLLFCCWLFLPNTLVMAGNGSVSARPVVVVVRHGERLDEADRELWRKIRTEQNISDDNPPLTERGRMQARQAGALLKQSIREESQIGHVAPAIKVLCSPTSRTIDTAVELCLELGVQELMPHFALNCCAAAKKEGVLSGQQALPTEQEMKGISLLCWPPAGDAMTIDDRGRRPGGFVETVLDLAYSAACADVLILVTHREGIWELQKATGAQPGIGYCGFMALRVDQGGELGAVLRAHPRWQHFKGAPRPGRGPAPAPAPAASGMAVLWACRNCQVGGLPPGRRGASRNASVNSKSRSCCKLWVTPGAKDLYVEGSAMTCGEVLHVLAGTVESEGGQGGKEGKLFVGVRRENGMEGWVLADMLQPLVASPN